MSSGSDAISTESSEAETKPPKRSQKPSPRTRLRTYPTASATASDTTSSGELSSDEGEADDSAESVISVSTASVEDLEPGFLPEVGSIKLAELSSRQRSTYVDASPASLSESDRDDLESANPRSTLKQRYSSRGRLLRQKNRLGHHAPVASPSSSAHDGTKGKDESQEEDATEKSSDPIYENKLDPLFRHFDICLVCSGQSGWQRIPLLRRRKTQLNQRLDRLERKTRKQNKRARKSGDDRQRRAKGQYDEGSFAALHHLGVAQEEWKNQLADVRSKGAWIRCSTCSASSHTGCLPELEAKRLLKMINAEAISRHKIFKLPGGLPKPQAEFLPTDIVEGVQCTFCFESEWWCILCGHNCINGLSSAKDTERLTFRCKRCFRTAHYSCVQQVTGEDSEADAANSRQKADWKCMDCESWGIVDVVLAWRPSQSMNGAQEPEPRSSWQAEHKPSGTLPREYLVKFRDMSFNETQWVPHLWLRATHVFMLRRFLAHGCRLELEPSLIRTQTVPPANTLASSNSHMTNAVDSTNTVSESPLRKEQQMRRSKRIQLALTLSRETGEVMRGPPPPEPDAQQRIPRTWVTPDRVLDAYLALSTLSSTDLLTEADTAMFHRRPRSITRAGDGAGISEHKARLEQSDDHIHISYVNQDILENMSDGRILDFLQGSKVLVKWEDLEYEQSTWEDGARQMTGGNQWRVFVAAFRRYLQSRKVFVKQLDDESLARLKHERRKSNFKAMAQQPSYVTGGKMLDFQLEGLNWLRYGWHTEQPGILADEMGLGKTIQVISFIASLHHQFDGLAPFLIVVPNSVVMNWVREFEHWCPHLRVVPYFGGRESRGVIERFEMFHLESISGRQDLRAAVIICSDTTARGDPAPLRRVQQWHTLIVDEGTSLKAGPGTLIYKRLASLNAAHRLIMTGTPLNNNIGELFHLLNWLKPNAEWHDIKSLQKQYDILTPESINELQTMLRPYILRRLKKDVVSLPPRSEMLVPVSLTPLQKRVYKDVLERNVQDILALTDARGKREIKYNIGNLMNILMQLRKACQHPYLVAPTLERFGGQGYDAKLEAKRLLEASSKLMLLQKMLPRLRQRGHRVLIFSQFVIYLDIVESFLLNEGTYKYLRLDGSIGSRQRQQGISQFNAMGSDIFCYLISTRAGGVGINLASADTVIILDSDFNPHMDMQAIARAHRIGQKKKVLVFTLVTQDTAEERIVENARKKMILDHVIHAMDDEEHRPESLQDVLRHGARRLFQRGGTGVSSRDIRASEEDVDRLIKDCEDGEDVSQTAVGGAESLLSFAKVWEKEQEVDPTAAMAEESFWADLLEKAKAQETRDANEEDVVYGRGGPRKAKLQASQPSAFPGIFTMPQSLTQGGKETETSRDDSGVLPEDVDVDVDFTIDTSLSSTGTSSEGVPESAGEGVGASTKRKRGRPSKRDLAIKAASGAAAARQGQNLGGQAASNGQAPLGSLFTQTARRLAPEGQDSSDASKPKQRRQRRKKNDILHPPPTTLTSAAAPVAAMPGRDNGAIYHAIARITDPDSARSLADSAFPNQPDLARALFMAWQDVILTRQSGNGQSSNHEPTPGAAFRLVAESQRPMGPPSVPTSTVPSTGTLAGALGPDSADTLLSAHSNAFSAAPVRRRAGKPRETATDAAASVSASVSRFGSNTTPSATPVAQRPAAGPLLSSTRRQELIAAANERSDVAADASSRETSTEQAQRRHQANSAEVSASSEPQYSAKQIKDLLRHLPNDFMNEVRNRAAQGPPPALVPPEARTQLTTTHMAYFSLRMFQYLRGVHPLFHEAFTLIESELVPQALRKRPFEGAESLKMSIVQDRLSEAAHRVQAQADQAKSMRSRAKRTTTTQKSDRRTSGGQRQPAPSASPRTIVRHSDSRNTQEITNTAVSGTDPSRAHQAAHSDQQVLRSTSHSRPSLGATMDMARQTVLPPPSTMLSRDTSSASRRVTASANDRNLSNVVSDSGSGQPHFYDDVLNGSEQARSRTIGSGSHGWPVQNIQHQHQHAQQQQRHRGKSCRHDHAQSHVYDGVGQQQHVHTSFSAGGSHIASGREGSFPHSALTPTAEVSESMHLTDAEPRPIPQDTEAPPTASRHEAVAFHWLQFIDMFNLAGLSKAARMWLLQPADDPQRDVMGSQINSALGQILEDRRRLGQPIPEFFQP